MERCGWAGPEEIYVLYHDEEWGVPERDPRALWEKLVLDGFQAGLSWITILKKRDNFRAAFADFDPQVIAEWGEKDVQRLLSNPGIIRHRGKIEATIGNAQAYLRINEAAQRAMKLPDEKVHNNIQKYGNTTSATLPLCFQEARQAGKAPEGSLVAFTALGAGLHWGSVLMRV